MMVGSASLRFLLISAFSVRIMTETPNFRQFDFAQERCNFTNEVGVVVDNIDSLLSCAICCSRSQNCMGVKIQKERKLCHLFSTYVTKTGLESPPTSDTECARLNIPCGFALTSVSGKYERANDVITTSGYNCDEESFFFGTGLEISCVPGSSQWTSSGTCMSKELQIKMPATFLREMNATLTVAGTPIANKLILVWSDENGTYPLKMIVDLDQKEVKRMVRKDTFQLQGTEPDTEFPFIIGTPFVMQLTSTEDNITCTVDGKQLFSFKHVLDRDIVSQVEVREGIFVHYVLYN